MQEKRQSKWEIKIVLGFTFGDEGKGNTVQWLCKEAIAKGRKPLVIRFSGGAQAGHRVLHNGMSHICSSYGSGVLLDVPTLWINPHNTFIDPCAIGLERQALIKETGKDPGYPYINNFNNSRFVHPFDMLSNKSDKKTLSDGSCGMGIYACFRRYCLGYNGVYDAELYYSQFDDMKYEGLRKRYDDDYNALEWWHCDHTIKVTDYDTLIFEGSQGLLLDMDNGFMPNCTPSHTGLNGIPQEYLTTDTDVYLVTRAYLTRHGNGYMPEMPSWIEKCFSIEEPTNVDTGYQGKFKRGILDIDLLNRAIDRHHLDNYQCKFHVVVNHLDTLLPESFVPVRVANEIRHLSKNDLIQVMYRNLRLPLHTGDIYTLSINSEQTSIKY